MQASNFYIVRKDVWYVERSVWLISGCVTVTSTLLALFAAPVWVLLVTFTGISSLLVAATGVCPVGTVLLRLGVPAKLTGDLPMLGSWRIYRMRTDAWFLERGIYLVVGTNLTLASLLVLAHSPGWLLFTGFVGAASVVFAATGFCPVANVLYWLGFEPRLSPEPERSRHEKASGFDQGGPNRVGGWNEA